ncbi:hypothetical protein MNB_SV-4-1038 [hydrothermal vent metagenome]|uniref:Uncharacterized protein n=1 Tax=hydrothermal vent metagenome TaxID=652676 RepID=A0A1W1E7C6_9ZZZZ
MPFICTVIYADLSVKQIEKMIERIHLKREGVGLDVLENTKEPFIIVKEENNETIVKVPKDEPDAKLMLHAIMGKKAYINDGWKKEGDAVLGYTIKYVGKRGVVLRNGNTIKKLFLGKPKNNLIMLEERE